MHFVIGGACNGKAEWVRTQYNIGNEKNFTWIKAYESTFSNRLEVGFSYLVIEGIEYWVKQLSIQYESDKVRTIWKEALLHWGSWETEDQRVILIGSDITRGIVPMEKADRKWRDDAGWTFQETVQACDRVDHIWYGIGQRLK